MLCVFTLRNRGYTDRRYFEHVDHVFTTSPYLSDVYRQQNRFAELGIDSPIEWSEVEAPEALRRFVTFVNPSLAKGAMVFARLADMLGSRRPDIPLLVVQSATTAGKLNAIPGLDFEKYPHIMAAPATPRPADFFALTRILLVPSVGLESFGRVAAEALINGIPPLVSDRGGLPQTVRGAGRVLPLPRGSRTSAQSCQPSKRCNPGSRRFANCGTMSARMRLPRSWRARRRNAGTARPFFDNATSTILRRSHEGRHSSTRERHSDRNATKVRRRADL